ncbi:histidine phosphatase family protein [Sedimentibacter sp. zth1]|uniref:histidine phosphatase family protein n=1 Tax=Sedimentibacter sp. zth1 TaxID=2816908 RepID=UPI001A92BCC2|nr:histidine phosphatase family protein [Sedimentibacter sp. zth1]QSX05555.1 histidine phosphatase family protein [Sedimentibacter sp. zth1]
MILYITRHGETEWNVQKRFQGQTNSELTSNGIEGARKLGEFLVGEDIDLIIASPLKRTVETADIIKKNIDIPVVYDKRLMEICAGDLEGQQFDIARKKYGTVMKEIRSYPFVTPYPSGESIMDVYNRISQFIEDIKKKYKDKNILIVTHGVVVKCMYYYLNFGQITKWDKPSIENCSLTKFKIEDNCNEKIIFNDVSHLSLVTN